MKGVNLNKDIAKADELFEEGECLFQANNANDYYDFFEKASITYQFFENWEKYLWCQYRITIWLCVRHQIQKAKDIAENELERCLQKIVGEHELKAEFHYRLFYCNFYQANYESATYHANECLKIAQALNHSTLIIKAYNAIASINLHLEKYTEGLSFLFKALSYSKFLAQNLETIHIYQTMGHAYFHLRQFHLSRVYFLRTIDLYKKLFGKEYPPLTNCMLMMGMIDTEQENFSEALEYFSKLIDIKEKLQIEDRELTSTLFYLAKINVYLGNWEKAGEYFEKSISVQERIQENSYRWFANTYYTWANIHIENGHFEVGKFYLEKAITTLPSETTLPLIHAYLLKVDIALKENKYTDALNYIGMVRDCLRNIIANQSGEWRFLQFSFYKRQLFIYWKLYLENHSITYLQKGNALLSKALQLIDETRMSLFSNLDKLEFNQTAISIYHTAINLTYALFSINREHKLLEQIFILSEKSKVHSLLASIQDFEALQLPNIPKKQTIKLLKLQLQIKDYQKYLEVNEADISKENFDKNAEELANLQVRYHQLIQQIEQENSEYFALKHQMPSICLNDFQVQLAKHQTAISYVLEAEFLYILYMDNQNIHLTSISLPPHFPQLLDTFIDEAILGMNRKVFVEQAHQLYQLLILPIEGKLKQNKTQSLLILPDSHLLELSFGLLLTEATPFKTAYSNMPYLFKEYSITYHYSATLRQYQQQRNKGSKNLPPQFLGFAPVYDTQQFPSNVSEALPAEATRDVSIRGTHYKALLYSEQEVKDIEANFQQKGWQSQVFLRAKANLEEFKKKAQQTQPKYLHIAAHGVSNRRKNVLGILFSPDKKQTPISTDTSSKANPLEPRQQNALSTQSAILYAHELYQLKLKSDLVFLSCCESGVGKIAAGEGILSLNRGLLYAGVPNIVFTLFKIYDQKTAIFAHHFYDYLLNQEDNYAQALRYAKLQLLKEDLPPRYWGGFLLLGN